MCALLFLSVIVCCWIRTKNIRRTKTRHAQLLDVLRRPPGLANPLPEPDSHLSRPGSSRPPSAPASAPDKWLCTPTRWTSVPEAYQLPATAQYGLLQLPFPQFPPVFYHGGFPGCGRDPQYHQPGPWNLQCTVPIVLPVCLLLLMQIPPQLKYLLHFCRPLGLGPYFERFTAKKRHGANSRSINNISHVSNTLATLTVSMFC